MLATWNGLTLRSQEIVLPNDLAEADGNSATTTPDGTVNGLRFMDTCDASQFQALTPPAYLTGYALRPDQTIIPSGPRTIRARIYASTTRRPLAEFSTRFEDNALHLGRFTLEYDLDVWVPTFFSTGTAELIAANGDRLFADVVGQATAVDPDHVSIVEIYTITDGTGRFQGASGSFMLLRSLVRSTGATGGSFEGTLGLPRGK